MFDVGLPQGWCADAKAKTGQRLPEGPAWHPSGTLYFNDIAGNAF
jgi:sugar lactone lactonase YvrE